MKSRPAAVIFILVTVTLDILAMGLIIPVLPKLILDFLGGEMTDAAKWSARFAVVFALMQFFFSPLLGVLSDRFGRRPIILLSNLGLGLDYIVMAMAPTLSWLFLGRIISGITTSSIPTAMAYIADVTPKEKRAGAFGLIGVAFGVGFTFGPAIGGLAGDINPRLAFWIAAALSLANWLWGYFFVPESLAKNQRKEFQLRRANPVGSLKLLRSHHELWRLTTIQFLAYFAHNVFSVWALYAIYRYSWSQGMIGLSLMIVGIVTAVISGGLTGGHGETFRGKTDALYRPVFRSERNAYGRAGQNRRVVTGFDPDHFTLEHFHASCAEHDDSSRQRARARRITRRASEHAFDHVHYRPMDIPSNFWMVHRSEKPHSPSGRTVLSGGRLSFYRDADVDTHSANTGPIKRRPCRRACHWCHRRSPRLALRRLPKRKKIFEHSGRVSD